MASGWLKGGPSGGPDGIGASSASVEGENVSGATEGCCEEAPVLLLATKKLGVTDDTNVGCLDGDGVLMFVSVTSLLFDDDAGSSGLFCAT